MVWVASVAHEGGHWNPENLEAEVSYHSRAFYQNSKLYNVSTTNSSYTLALLWIIILQKKLVSLLILLKDYFIYPMVNFFR